MDNLNANAAIASLKHGQRITSKVLGEMSVVSKGSALSSGFGYPVPVSQVAMSQSLLLLLDDLYIVIEPLDAKRVCVLFPVGLAKILCPDEGYLKSDKANGLIEPLHENRISDTELMRLLTSQLSEEHPIGVCLRGQKGQLARCVYQVLPKYASLAVLENTLNRIVDFALLVMEWGQEYRQKLPGRHLECAVESHRF